MKKTNDKNTLIDIYKHFPSIISNLDFFETMLSKLSLLNIDKVEVDYDSLSKTNIKDTLKYIKEFYHLYHFDEVNTINNYYQDGKIKIIYKKNKFGGLCRNLSNGIIDAKIYINKTVVDTNTIIHETRHLLNSPSSPTECYNILTESLSIFDELLYNDYSNNEETTMINKRLFFIYYEMAKKNLPIIKRLKIEKQLGINYKYMINYILYIFGSLIASNMFINYKNDPHFLVKFSKLNDSIKEKDITIEEALKIVDIDLTNEYIVDELVSNFDKVYNYYLNCQVSKII